MLSNAFDLYLWRFDMTPNFTLDSGKLLLNVWGRHLTCARQDQVAERSILGNQVQVRALQHDFSRISIFIIMIELEKSVGRLMCTWICDHDLVQGASEDLTF